MTPDVSVLEYLVQHGSITRKEALILGVFNLSNVIELICNCYPVEIRQVAEFPRIPWSVCVATRYEIHREDIAIVKEILAEIADGKG